MRVQPDMLRAAASALRGAGAAITVVATPATAMPLAPDPASTAAIARLNEYAKGLAHVLGQGSNRLTFLNFKLSNDATHYETTDQANSDLINSSVGLGGSGAGGGGGGGTGGASSTPAQSSGKPETLGGLSPVPPLAEPGESFAALLESAPGSSALSEYFTTLKSVLDALTFGHPLITKGKGMVTEGWDTSDSNSDPASAATQTISHMSDWSTHTTAYTNSLHQAATNTSSAFETLKATHPTTTEYAAAHSQIQAGQTMITSAAATMNPVALVTGYMTLQQGVAEKAALDVRASTAQTTYSSTLQSATNLPTQLPSISGGGSQQVGTSDAPFGGGGEKVGLLNSNAGSTSSGGADTSSYGSGGGSASSYGGGSGDGSSYGSSQPSGSSYGSGGQGDPSSLGSQSSGSGYSPGADPGLDSGNGTSGTGDGGALGAGGAYAPFAPGGLAGLAGGGGGGFSGGTPSLGGTGRLIGQSGLAATSESTANGSGLSAQQGKVAAVPTTGQKAGATPMMPLRGAGAGGSGKDKERERDKALNPDIQVDDDTEYGPAVLGVQPRKRVASTSLPKQDA